MLFALSLSLILLFAACNHQLNEVGPAEQTEALQKTLSLSRSDSKDEPIITKESDYLVFKNWDEFQQTLKKNALLNEKDRIAWEEKYGFVSMKAIYESVVAEEQKALKSVFSEFEKQKVIETGLATELGRRYKYMLRVSQETGIDMETLDDAHGRMVNPRGVVKIGKHIYQFNYLSVKIIENADAQKIDMLPNITTSNAALGITVSPVTRQVNPVDMTTGRSETHIPRSCQNGNGYSRVLGYYDYYRWEGGPNHIPPAIFFTHTFRVRCLEKQGFWWVNGSGRLELNINIAYYNSLGQYLNTISNPLFVHSDWGHTLERSQLLNYATYNLSDMIGSFTCPGTYRGGVFSCTIND